MAGTSLFLSIDPILFKNVKILQYLHFEGSVWSYFLSTYIAKEILSWVTEVLQYFIPPTSWTPYLFF